MKKDINRFLDDVKKLLERHKCAPYGYARRTIDIGTPRLLDVSTYGTTDALNILYTINEFPSDPAERAEWVKAIQATQDEETGLFVDFKPAYTFADDPKPSELMHCTAFAAATLELFDAKPLYKLSAYDKFRTKEGLHNFLDELDWGYPVWQSSHRGAGLFSAMNVSGEATHEWNDWFCEWLWNETDEETGFWRKGRAEEFLYRNMGSGFHYLFCLEHIKMPLRYPEKVIDTCLRLYNEQLMNPTPNHIFGKKISFVEIDWVYYISRAARQTTHRADEVKRAISEFAESYIDYLLSLDLETHVGADDIHDLFGALCCVADLQTLLPGQIISDKPLRLVLERRPFI